MALEEYAAKRRFDRTPEPAGQEAHSAGPLKFVVQKHQASHLHYDFRLELAGVLKSWAVPKGPSMNPADKRLAMMVEDHPYDYRHFEGIIPKGQYGGGTVMIWDEGTYTHPDTLDRDEAEQLLKQGLHRGELKIVMAGSKLAGKFVLVRTGDPENAWLLIKEKDKFVSGEEVTAQDRSARTGRTLDQIASASDAVWQSKPRPNLSGAPEADRPADLRPMLASLAPAPFSDSGWIFEVKWDGYRIMAQTGPDARLVSRGGQDYSERYHEITRELAGWQIPAVVDGEMVVVDEAGLSHFQRLQDWPGLGGQLVFYLFDVIWTDGRDVRHWPVERRRELLREIMPQSEVVRFSDHITGEGEAFYRAASQAGLEGVMAKRLGSRYQEGRHSRDWLKLKILHEQEAVICGFTEPRGGRKDLGALILGVYEGNNLRYIGHTGGGIDAREGRRLRQLLAPLAGQNPFGEKIKTNAPATWVKPKIVCQVKFNGWTNGGHMRQPIYLGLRQDKKPREVSRERPIEEVPVKDHKPPKKAAAKAKFEVTHPDKVFWPDDGYTKGDLAAYYADIAPVILPYLEGRPESLHRHPGGITGQSFFQKNIDYEVPDFMETVKVHSEGEDRDINYLVCNNAQSLEYLANLGCIELNPWHSRVGKLDKPNYLLLDLDAKTAQFSEIVEVAQAVRQVLLDLEITGLPKTSGKTGLHVCIPLGAKYDYEQSKQLAELIMRLVLARVPQITSIERSPGKRRGKVYLDYLQNRRGQTMAAPYCVRPVPGATVSAPLEWEEVNAKLDPTKFTIKTMGRRLDKVGDLWKPVLGPGVDIGKLMERFGDA